jgi:pSer/pThr/pTyr-binding forkhead associated (FHA) protein
MPILTLKFQEKALGEFTLESGKSLSIGRMADNDVAIDNLAVSGHHAKIDAVGNEYIFTDLKSKNGSFVNDEMVSSHKLQHSDIITIGKHTLIFTYKDDEPRPEKVSEDFYETMVMDTGKHRAMMEKSKQKSAVSPQKLPKAALSLLAGDQGEVIITKKLFKIGKSELNDYQIKGLWIGQTAATISQRPDGYYLSYVDGVTKPKLNGVITKTSVRIKEFDIIEIGRVKMQLVFKTPKSE